MFPENIFLTSERIGVWGKEVEITSPRTREKLRQSNMAERRGERQEKQGKEDYPTLSSR